MIHFLIVAVGGGLGAGLRYLSGLAVGRLAGHGFPFNTIFVNVVGSFAMGLLIVWLAKRTGGASQELRLFFATGLLGGFTTFSAFSLDVATLMERGDLAQATGYILSSVLISIFALFIGLWVARALL